MTKLHIEYFNFSWVGQVQVVDLSALNTSTRLFHASSQFSKTRLLPHCLLLFRRRCLNIIGKSDCLFAVRVEERPFKLVD
jgi:hypothetical protein